MSRRPSVSIYNYPENLNPFNDDSTTTTKVARGVNGEVKKTVKEPKNKFWTFGRSKKKQRSNSFSIKSTWSGLFGKRKDSQEVEISKPTIATVSSTYKCGTNNGYPVAPPRSLKDQQEFDEALGTLARRRKYTLDNSSRYSSTLTVNGDPGRMYEGSPQDTTTSIMGELTPKPPARRFGQVSPKPTDNLPPLNYGGKESTSNENVVPDERASNRTPIPPKRGGPRSSQRFQASASLHDDVTSPPADVSLRDENENVPEDYLFKRFNQDAIRKSNLSINSCVSIGSTVSAYGRKKRRAPQPPRNRELLETPKENNACQLGLDESTVEHQIFKPMDIARVTENIDEMTKRSLELDESFELPRSQNDEVDIEKEKTQNIFNPEISDDMNKTIDTKSSNVEDNSRDQIKEAMNSTTMEEKCTNFSNETLIVESKEELDCRRTDEDIEAEVEVELRRKPSNVKNIEISKDAECYSSRENLPLMRRRSSGNLSRSDSFSVKEEIEKIERQIKILEAKNSSTTVSNEEINIISQNNRKLNTRLSLPEIRKNFFRNMVDEDRVKVELRELPREQNDITIIRIDDPPIPNDGPCEPVKIIELHITEPIRQKPTITVDCDVNPIPKPRRHSNLEMDVNELKYQMRQDEEDDDKKGNSF